jgi:hypothetical protein
MIGQLEVAELAANGHSDDVRTYLALLVTLNGAAKRLNARLDLMLSTGCTEQDALITLARSWDGLDGEHDVRRMRDAAAVVLAREEALG